MTADEILDQLEAWGLPVTNRTLTNYVRWGLVSSPQQRTGGKGKRADYPDHAVIEAAAAAELMQMWRWKKDRVATARKFFAKMDAHGIDVNDIDFNKPETVSKICENMGGGIPNGVRAVILIADVKILWETLKYYLMLNMAK